MIVRGVQVRVEFFSSNQRRSLAGPFERFLRGITTVFYPERKLNSKEQIEAYRKFQGYCAKGSDERLPTYDASDNTAKCHPSAKKEFSREELIEQRDEFERLLHKEVDLSNNFYLEWQNTKRELERSYNRTLFQRIFNLKV